jgi:site-specific recombinase XerD
LEAAALTPRQWTHDTIPQRLTTDEVERVLALYTGKAPTDLRNRAILILLARLGLRAHEVISLSLDDINWHEAHLIIRTRKTRHERMLPLSQDVGGALADYLRWGRPVTTSRVIFLHCRAPFRPFSGSAAISRIAARALVRTGVTGHARLGAHVFRHTAASGMVNRGASFKDVADVLGHQSLQTTGIYAKLDLDALSEVALPWIGDSQ